MTRSYVRCKFLRSTDRGCRTIPSTRTEKTTPSRWDYFAVRVDVKHYKQKNALIMDLWTQQLGLVDDCLRACVFCDYIWRQDPPEDSAWPAISDICYSDAIISWNQVFGQRSQETHWSKLVQNIKIPIGDNLKSFNQAMIVTYLGITDAEWEVFHKLMVDARNTRVAHLNVGHAIKSLPNITKAMHTSYLYRDWLIEALHHGNRIGYNINISQDRAKDAVEKYRAIIARAYHGL